MVTIRYPQLTLGGCQMNADKDMANVMPTAFSGLRARYGADSCSDHPGTGTLDGAVFIPGHHSYFYPDLNNRASFECYVNNVYTIVFSGFVDSLTVKDVENPALPAGFDNARNMQNTIGWSFRKGTSPTSPSTPATFIKGGSHIEVATAAAPGADQWVFITSPRAPVNAGKHYRITGMFHAANRADDYASEYSDIRLDLLWYGAAGVLIRTDNDYFTNLGSSFRWRAMKTNTMYPPPLATHVALRSRHLISKNTANGTPWPAAVDGLTLHEVDGVRADARPVTRHAPGRTITFTAADATATAARTMLGNKPWPAQSATERLGEITSSTFGIFNIGGSQYGNQTMLAYRDIDNQSALEVLQRVANSLGEIAVAGDAINPRIDFAELPRYPQVLGILPSGMAAIIDDPGVVSIPAAAIRDSALKTSITGLSNQIRFGYRKNTMEGSEDAQVTATNPASMAAYGPMTRTIDTDLTSPTGRAWDKARALVNTQSKTVYGLADRVNLVASQIPDGPEVAPLFQAINGFRRLIIIPGAPALIGEYHRIKAGAFTFGKDLAVSLDVEPADQITPDSITLGEVYIAPNAGVKLPKYANVTIGAMRTTSNPT